MRVELELGPRVASMRPPPKSRGKLRAPAMRYHRVMRFNEAPAEKQGKTKVLAAGCSARNALQ